MLWGDYAVFGRLEVILIRYTHESRGAAHAVNHCDGVYLNYWYSFIRIIKLSQRIVSESRGAPHVAMECKVTTYMSL